MQVQTKKVSVAKEIQSCEWNLKFQQELGGIWFNFISAGVFFSLFTLYILGSARKYPAFFFFKEHPS